MSTESRNQIALISEAPIDPAALLATGHDPRSGAVVLFSGEARNHNEGREVRYLEYEAYAPLAEKIIREIVQTARERFDLNQALCVHRVGRVGPGECAVVVVTSAPHRSEAYAGNRYIIDRVKHDVPIWKREFFADGTNQWGRNCEHPIAADSPAYDAADGSGGRHPHSHSHSH